MKAEKSNRKRTERLLTAKEGRKGRDWKGKKYSTEGRKTIEGKKDSNDGREGRKWNRRCPRKEGKEETKADERTGRERERGWTAEDRDVYRRAIE
jgi:hypothetical protein